MWKVALIVASDRAARGEREDTSGPAIQQLIESKLDCKVVERRVLPDDIETLTENMIELTDRHQIDLLLTIGGTGLSPEDVTPEATTLVIDRKVPGIGEEMRRKFMEISREGMLTRAICGTRGNSLIINLPGAIETAKYGLQAVADQLHNALLILQGKKGV